LVSHVVLYLDLAGEVVGADAEVVEPYRFNGANFNYVTIRYNAATGAKDWPGQPAYDNGGDDVPSAIGLFNNGASSNLPYLVVLGRSPGTGGNQYAAIRYRQLLP
jgi:hypothetical protein